MNCPIASSMYKYLCKFLGGEVKGLSMSCSKLPLLSFVVFNWLTLQSVASPWANPGDVRLRSDVEVLSQYGLISGPVNTWPISWSQITSNLYKSDGMILPSYVQAALNRVKKKIPSQVNAQTRASYVNNVEFFRGFENTSRQEKELQAELELNLEQTSFHVEVQYGDDEELKLDGSYMSQNFGNWSTYVGSVQRWWGPGRETTTLLSTNARPMPSIGIRRIHSKPFGAKWLNWMGPWQFDFFLSKMDKDRFVPSPMFIGMKFSFEPIENFEIGLARTLMMCGEGRVCSLETWMQGLIGFGDLDNIGTIETQPGNQLAQLDLSYSFSWKDNVNVKLYAEGTAEDLIVVLPYTYSRLIGVSFYGPYGSNGDSWRITAEYSDTTGSLAWLYGEHRKGIMYNHHIYRDGYRYQDKVIGHSLDSDSNYFSIKATLVKSRIWELSLNYQNMLINSENISVGQTKNHLSASRESINRLKANITANTEFGKFHLDGKVMDNDINTPFENDFNFSIGMGWEYEF